MVLESRKIERLGFGLCSAVPLVLHTLTTITLFAFVAAEVMVICVDQIEEKIRFLQLNSEYIAARKRSSAAIFFLKKKLSKL